MKASFSNSVSLAGEFAVLSKLALRGYDANKTLGHTKGVDILVSDPKTRQMFHLEVKTTIKPHNKKPHESKFLGKFISKWIMNKNHEKISSPNLFYCFVDIARNKNSFRFFIVPSKIVARYVKRNHQIYLNENWEKGNKVKDSDMRAFRIGIKGEKYPLPTPTADQYENNWSFKL